MKKPNQSACVEIIKKRPDATQPEVNAELKKQGYSPAASSMVSGARKKLGISKRSYTKMKEVKIHEVVSSGDVAVVLGISIKETIETIDVLIARSMEFGGINRLRDALELLRKIKES